MFKRRIVLSIIIFCLVLFALGVPYFHMGFIADDFGNIFYSQVHSWNDFLKFFTQDTRVFLLPSNYEFGQTTFFSVYYRPLIFVFYYLQSLLFGTVPYGFFLVTVFFHALNSVLLFNIVLTFSDFFVAFLSAMFFAFHSSLLNWFGWISAQQQQISLFLILFVFIFLKKYLDTNKYFYYLLSIVFFILALFTRETALILPFLIWYGAFLYKKWAERTSLWNKILYGLYFAIAFFLIDFLYLVLRAILFPLKIGSSSAFAFFNFYCVLKDRFYEFVCMSTDLLDLSLFSPGHSYIKSCIFIIVSIIFLFLFFLNSKKKWVVFFGLSGFVLLWPAVFVSYGSRYLYEALPLFIIAAVLCICFFQKAIQPFFRAIVFSAICLLIIFNFVFFIYFLKCKECDSYNIQKAYDELVCDQKINGREICCIGIPIILANSTAPAIWLRLSDFQTPVYCEFSTCLASSPELLTWFKRFFVFLEKLESNYLQVIIYPGKINLKSLDSSKIFFGYGKKGSRLCSMGKIIVNEIARGNRVCDIDLIIDQKYLDKNLLFVTWDYQKQKFLILN